MKRRLTSLLLSAVLAAPLAFSQRHIKPEDFGTKLGRAKKDNVIEFNGNGFYRLQSAHFEPSWSIAYSRIMFDGLAEVNFPLSYLKTTTLPDDPRGTAIFQNCTNEIIGLGIKIRDFVDNIDEGVYHGIGIRFNWITTKYQRSINGEWTDFSFTYQNFIPHIEYGYAYKLESAPSFGFRGSIEAGFLFSTFDKKVEDPPREPIYGVTELYTSINAGFFYTF